MTNDIKSALVTAATRYDRAEAEKAQRNPRRHHHNFYALGMYLNRVDDILRDIAAGADPSAAIIAGTHGALRTALLKAIGAKADHRETGAIVYRPVAAKGD